MDIDPDLDPEERTNKLFAIASVAFGILSLCGSIMFICGAPLSALGILLGWFGRRSEYKTMATIGIGFSIVGLLTAIVYAVFISIIRA